MLRSGWNAPLGWLWRRTASASASDDPKPALTPEGPPPSPLGGFGHLPGRTFDPPAVARFAELATDLDVAGLLGEVEALRARAVSEQVICVELIAPAARLLARRWEREECDFVTVTMGLWRLQEVLRETSATSAWARQAHGLCRRALLAPIPGQGSSFMTLLTNEAFVSAGWESEVLVQPTRCELLARLGERPVDVLGLTAARDCPSAAVASLVRALRSVSANPQLVVILSGTMISHRPGLARDVGADGAAAEGRATLALAQALVEPTPALRAAVR